MNSVQRRLQRLEVTTDQGEGVDRWWCEALPESERAACLSEPLDLASMESDWWQVASEVLNEAQAATEGARAAPRG